MKSVHSLRNRVRTQWELYIFLILPLVYLLLFSYAPMVGLQIAFKKFTIRSGIWGSSWVGLTQFEKFLSSYKFIGIFRNTLTISLYSILAGFPLPILFALLLNCMRQPRYKRFIQTMTYMPHFISTVVIVGLLIQLFNPRVGLYGTVYHALYGMYPGDPLGDARLFPHLYVWSGVWQQFGWGSIVYLAALSSVSPELHEAAQIDGANRFQRMLHVDLPCILPTATVMLILRAGSIMSLGFEKAYLMQNSLNLETSELISTYVYKIGMGVDSLPNYSYSTAIGLFNSVINLFLISTVNWIARKIGETSLW